MKFYYCKHCKKIITILQKDSVPTICCGEAMVEIVPGTTDAAVEKHVPVVLQKGNTVEVSVGSVEHPMTPEHFIQWIVLETKQGSQYKALNPTDSPKACFSLLDGESAVCVYAYCNLHGLWASK